MPKLRMGRKMALFFILVTVMISNLTIMSGAVPPFSLTLHGLVLHYAYEFILLPP
jgi:hypothetical protein